MISSRHLYALSVDKTRYMYIVIGTGVGVIEIVIGVGAAECWASADSVVRS